ncbi:putative capsular polysaccharide synthesis family protein [Motilimonas pumila]|nr:putative capsular polysaccharide synthesis family protein [Motilimonas pumila]
MDLKQLYWNMICEFNTRRQVKQLKHEIKQNKPIILIHQPGRVGSMTIRKTTESLGLPSAIYHTHFINPETNKKQHEFYNEHLGKVNQRHMRIAKVLGEAILSGRYQGTLKVIVTVRDPLRRELSNFMLDVEKYYRKNFFTDYSNGAISINEVQELFLNSRRELTRDNWFDDDVKTPFNIDIFTQEFDHNKKYNIYRNGNVELLLFRLEDISEVIQTAFKDYFGIEPKQIVSRHLSGSRSMEDLCYREISDKLKFNTDFLDQIYQTDYARFFYSNDERADFCQSWGKVQEA